MSIGPTLVPLLSSLVDGRFYMNTFPDPGKGSMTVPAIRCVVVSSTPSPTICGAAGEEADDVRIQLDAVDRDYSALVALRHEIVAALSPAIGPWRRNVIAESYDVTTKLHRCMLDFTLTLSGGGVDSPTTP